VVVYAVGSNGDRRTDNSFCFTDLVNPVCGHIIGAHSQQLPTFFQGGFEAVYIVVILPTNGRYLAKRLYVSQPPNKIGPYGVFIKGLRGFDVILRRATNLQNRSHPYDFVPAR